MPNFLLLLFIFVWSQGLVGCATLDAPPPAPTQETKGVNFQKVLATIEARTPKIAKNYYGLPYRMAANPDLVKASDCTHLVCAITRNSLDGTPYLFSPYYIPSSAIMENTVPVSRSDLRVGDMIFFHNGTDKKIDHAGIITAKNNKSLRFVHASSIKGVSETSTHDTGYRYYWEKRFNSFRRWKPSVFSLRSNMLASSR